MGLFDLLKEETKVEEPQKEEIKEAEVVENEAAVNEPKKEVKKKTKKNSKPETKNERVKKEPETKSLEEQIATVPDNLKTKIDVIYQHLMTIPGTTLWISSITSKVQLYLLTDVSFMVLTEHCWNKFQSISS